MLWGRDGIAFNSFTVVHQCLRNHDRVFLMSTAYIVMGVKGAQIDLSVAFLCYGPTATDCPDPDK